MKPLSDLVHAHVGRPALVMGGGDSLPAQAARAPESCVFISTNQHGCLLRRCDYIVACDDKPGKRFAGPGGMLDLKALGTPIISPRVSMADYRIFARPVPNNSGIVAAWIAWVMGCAPILTAGMDCYVGGTYWHSPKAQSTGHGLMLDRHLAKWQVLKEKLPQAMVRSLGGPLTSVFPAYDPAETTPALPARAEVEAPVLGKRVRVVRSWRKFGPGLDLQVSVAEFEEGRREGSLILL